VERLLARVAELEARLDQNSRNSGKPPSSDSPGQRAERPGKPRTGRKRGGQPGHRGHERAPFPPEKVTRWITREPRCCRRCREDLSKARVLDPIRHQTVELPKVQPSVTEFVLGRRRCRRCSTVTCATLPRGVPRGMCGPRLLAFIGLLTGVHHLSRRSAQQLLSDLLGIKLSLGCLSQGEAAVAQALEAPAQEALVHARAAPAKNVDATSWVRSGKQRALWVLACATATVFGIMPDASTAMLTRWLRNTYGVLMSDRGSQFGFWAMKRRQICWAHLVRKFVALSESAIPEVKQLGEHLLLLSGVHLRAWHEVRDGTASRVHLQQVVRNLEDPFMNLLEHGVQLDLRGVSGACQSILDHREALFTYAFVEGVEPTNNHAERELRRFVLWRKRSFGSQSQRGDHFAARIMTVTHTLRKQDRNVFAFLIDACTNALRAADPPVLLPAST
jgi:transposase